MKASFFLASLTAGIVIAQSPIGTINNDIVNGVCANVTFIYARGTAEEFNFGSNENTGPGQDIARSLRSQFNGNVAVQGVNYGATTVGNFFLPYADPLGQAEVRDIYQRAFDICPQTIIVGSGYSQGAAIIHGGVPSLPANVRARIAGISQFGDTAQQASGQMIGGIPTSSVQFLCNSGDRYCEQFNGVLTVLTEGPPPSHTQYKPRASEAANFLASRIRAFGA